MRIWYNAHWDDRRYAVEVVGARVRIGRADDNDIVLNNPHVAPRAAVIRREAGGWELRPLGKNPCQVDGRTVHTGQREVLKGNETIVLWPYTLTLELPPTAERSREEVRRELDRELVELQRAVHLALLETMDVQGADEGARDNDEYLLRLEQTIEELARLQGIGEPRRSNLVEHAAGLCIRAELLAALTRDAGQPAAASLPVGGPWSRLLSQVPERERELHDTVARFAGSLGLGRSTDLSEQADLVEKDFWPAWEQRGPDVHLEFKQYLALRALKKEIKDIVFGYGPLEDLLRLPTVSEIMVVDRDHIYVEKGGVVENSGRRFLSDAVTLSIIERIVSRVGRRIDKSSPLVNARLADGSRVNAVIPPLAVSGPCLTIRKFPLRRLHVADLIERGALTPTVAEFLRAAVLTRKNILISGGTGTGKTTLLNCLSDFIPDKERIVTLEDTAELQLHKEHVVRLETKERNLEGAGAYTIRDLVTNALRMRPDRIIVGECRGPEALDMLQAMNTGHAGSMTTIHANTAADMVGRLEVLVLMAAELPLDAIHRQIASAIDLVVQLRRFRDGTRRIVQVTEIVGMDQNGGGLRLKDLFALEGNESPALRATGFLPTFLDELIEKGETRLESFYR